MLQPCGQCRQPFSAHCQTLKYCPVHEADCFECLLCQDNMKNQEKDEYKICSICDRASQEQDLYYDYQCDSHICRFHFLKMDFKAGEVTLPCGDKQETNQILVFMSSYCMLCGRKLANKHQSQLGICIPCEKKGFQSANKAKQAELAIKQQERLLQSIKAYQEKKVLQIQPNYSKVINQLKNELMLLQQSYKVSQFTRYQIKTAIHHVERDKDCLICLEPYNLANKKPMMVCLQQHLICEHCLLNQPGLNHCPLCRDEIVRAKVLPSRERMKTIQLQLIISEKYQTKLQKCLIAQQKQQNREQMIEIKQVPQVVDKKVPEQPKKIEKDSQSRSPSKQSFKNQLPIKKGSIPHKPRRAQLVASSIRRLTAPKRARSPSQKHVGNKKQKQQ